MSQPPPSSRFSFLQRIPSFIWILIVVLGIAGLIGTIMASCYLISHYEGAGTLFMIGAGWLAIRLGSGPAVASTTEKTGSTARNILVGLLIAFYALMGVAIDQPGNYLFNRPFEWIECPSGTELSRSVTVTHPLPERTDITQDFSCVTKESGQFVKRVGTFTRIWVRFVEYVLVGYGLMALNRLYMAMRARFARDSVGTP